MITIWCSSLSNFYTRGAISSWGKSCLTKPTCNYIAIVHHIPFVSSIIDCNVHDSIYRSHRFKTRFIRIVEGNVLNVGLCTQKWEKKGKEKYKNDFHDYKF